MGTDRRVRLAAAAARARRLRRPPRRRSIPSGTPSGMTRPRRRRSRRAPRTAACRSATPRRWCAPRCLRGCRCRCSALLPPLPLAVGDPGGWDLHVTRSFCRVPCAFASSRLLLSPILSLDRPPLRGLPCGAAGAGDALAAARPPTNQLLPYLHPFASRRCAFLASSAGQYLHLRELLPALLSASHVFSVLISPSVPTPPDGVAAPFAAAPPLAPRLAYDALLGRALKLLPAGAHRPDRAAVHLRRRCRASCRRRRRHASFRRRRRAGCRRRAAQGRRRTRARVRLPADRHRRRVHQRRGQQLSRGRPFQRGSVGHGGGRRRALRRRGAAGGGAGRTASQPARASSGSRARSGCTCRSAASSSQGVGVRVIERHRRPRRRRGLARSRRRRLGRMRRWLGPNADRVFTKGRPRPRHPRKGDPGGRGGPGRPGRPGG